MEKFAQTAILSIINQTYKNIEIIVVDDGSTDNTRTVLEKIKDARIKLIFQNNYGPSRAFNAGLSMCSGEYIAIFSGDDVSVPSRIEKSLNTAKQNPRSIVFTQVDFIDENSRIFESSWAQGLFLTLNMSPATSFERLFSTGNYLNASSCFASKAIWDEFKIVGENGPFDPLLIQLQDFDLWLRMSKAGVTLKVIEDRLLQYRILTSSNNLSQPNIKSRRRTDVEMFSIMENILDDMNLSFFKDVFDGCLKNPNITSEAEKKIEAALIFLKSLKTSYRLIGLKKLGQIIKDKELSKKAKELYSIDFKYYFEISGSFSVFKDSPFPFPSSVTSRLYVSDSRGYSENKSVMRYLSTGESGFNVEFDLSQFKKIKKLRFDPYEGILPVRLKLKRISGLLENNSEEEITSEFYSHNGKLDSDKYYSFNTNDPQFEILKPKRYKKIRISGEFTDDIN